MSKIRQILVLTVMALTLLAAAPSQSGAWGRGHFYVIGIGPSGPRMATQQALETIKRMDVVLAPEVSHCQTKLFADYIGDKPILFDPWSGLFDYKGKSMFELSREETARFETERFRIRDDRVKQIKALLEQGKEVGLLDSGNPCLFGPSHWYVEKFDAEDVVIVPGMGCDAAAMAVLGKSTIPAHDTRFVMQSAPFFLSDWSKDQQILKDLCKYPMTMVLYMALSQPQKLFAALQTVLPSDMPCAVVFWAGYPDRQRVVRGTVADMGEKLANDKERFMGLLFIGRFLEGTPYEKAIRRGQRTNQ